MSTPRIDEEAITELKEMLEDEFPDLIETYISDTQTKLDLLQQEIANGNAVEVRKLAHSLKGASVNIGIMAFGELCHDLEEQAKTEQSGDFKAGMGAITEEFATLVPLLNEYLN